jgi:hypothetical protein
LGADFVLAFVLFWAVALSLSAGHTRAYAVSLPALATEAIRPDSAVSTPASFRTDRPSQDIHDEVVRRLSGRRTCAKGAECGLLPNSPRPR